MPLDSPDFPVQLLVGRELALREKVDGPTATRLALTGTLVGAGLLGPIVAKKLAEREAPKPAPAATVPPVGVGSGQLDQIARQFQSWVDADKKAEEAKKAQADALSEQIAQMRKERTEALEKLCQSFGIMKGESSIG